MNESGPTLGARYMHAWQIVTEEAHSACYLLLGGDTLAIVPLSGDGLDLGSSLLEEMIQLPATLANMINGNINSKFL